MTEEGTTDKEMAIDQALDELRKVEEIARALPGMLDQMKLIFKRAIFFQKAMEEMTPKKEQLEAEIAALQSEIAALLELKEKLKSETAGLNVR